MGLCSMTGFGRVQCETPVGQFMVELRTVNNRYQDISVGLARELNALEPPLRALLKERVVRGKVDCRVRWKGGEEAQPTVRVNAELAGQYLKQLRRLSELGAAGEIPIASLTGLPGVLEVAPPELESETLWETLRVCVEEALAALEAERRREGEALAAQLSDLIQRMRVGVERIEALKDEVLARQRERLTARAQELAAELKTQLEPGRLELETAMLADRGDISEEITRLRAHLDRAAALTRNEERADAVGKNLDFLMQEIGREVNTICSKSRDTQITPLGLELKSLTEQMREQVQNIQ